MAVKARDQVTVAVSVDVASVDNYYKLQASTATPPTRPTTASPSGWTTTEPTYDGTSTNTLYICQKTTLTDGTFYWSLVSKSTSYEAAKTAYNLANSANNTANTTQENLDNLQIGGRNLLRYVVYNYAEANSVIGVSAMYRGMYCAVDGGETYTISRRTIEGNRFWIDWSEQEPASGVTLHSLSRDNEALKVTVDVPSEANWLFIYLSNQSDVINDGNIKVERGNKATDWTPAPEDTDAAIATKLDSSGNRIWYAECSTAAGTVAKTATITPATTAFMLTPGQTVNVLFKATNTGAVGNLTLAVNDTPAKGIRYLANGALANLPAANYLRINQIVSFTYDGTYWVTDLSYNSDTYTRTRWQNVVTILATPSGTWRLLCGTASGYTQIAAGVSFDLAYPILTFSNQPAANTTADTGYLSVNSLTFSNTAAIQSGSAGKAIYLKGVVSGNTFTIDSTNVFTTVVPTSEDGCAYIPLGIMATATVGYFKSSKDLYAYKDGAFGPVSIREASAAAKTATTYITHIDDNGITIHPKSTTNNRAAINANGMEVFKGNVSVASYGDTARIGKANGDRVVVDSTDGITIYKANSKRLQTTANGVDIYGSNGSTSIASFGSTTRIGLLNGWKTTIEDDGIRLYSGIYNNGNSPTMCIESGYQNGTTVGGAIEFDPEVTGVQTEIAGTAETNSAWLVMQAYRDLSSTKNTGASLTLETDPDYSTRAVLFATDGDNDSEITVTGDGVDMSNDLVVTGTVNGDALESNGAIYADTTVYAGCASTTGEAIYTGGSDYARFGYRSGSTYNYLTMGIDSNDDRYITLSSRTPWLSALDLSDAVKPYRSGETISGATRVMGYVTSSTKELRFTIPLCRPVAKDLTFNSMSIIPRGETGTLTTITPTSSTVTLARDPSGINVTYTASAAISGMTNNHAYALQVSYSFVVQS